MADLPPRLLDDPEASPLARALLRSADLDGPSPESRRAVARALGVAAAGTALAAGGSAGAWWIGSIAAVAIAAAGAVGYVVTRPDAKTPPPAAVAAPTAPEAVRPVAPTPTPTPVPVPTPELPVPPPAPVAVVPPVAEPAPAAPPRRAKARPHRVAAAPAPVPVPAPEPAAAPAPVPEPPPVEEPAPPTVAEPLQPVAIDPRLLAIEVGQVDRARARLAAGDPAGALAAVAEHTRTFPHGILAAEAEVVRIDALLRSGQRDAARRVGRQFLQRFPRSPLVQRVRSLLTTAGTAP